MNIINKTILLSLFFITTFGYSQNWRSNIETAKTEAKTENKNIFLVFSGSDWCAPCIKLDKNIFQSEVFKTEADKKWVLVKADFPKKKANLLTKELTESNKKLAEKYNKAGNFPLVILLDANGKVLGMTGFKNVSPIEYIQIINNLEKK
jgi:thioredoxin-related protein